MQQNLELTFLNTAAGKVRITIPNADNSLSGAEILTLMNGIIAAGALAPGGLDLASADGARLISTEVNVYDLV